MFLHLPFATLLAGALVILSTLQAEGLPIMKRQPGLVTLPLKRVNTRSDVHPSILLQQHINRGRRRLARLSGREEPSYDELARDLKKRVLSLGDEEITKRYLRFTPPKGTREEDLLEKRFDRAGVPKVNAFSLDAYSFHRGKGRGRNRNGGNGNGNGVAVEDAGATVVATATDVEDAGATVVATATAVAATDVAVANTGAGAGAGNNGAAGGTVVDGVTLANAPTADNSIGLDVEANDVGYQATIQIGTPPTDFGILMDSGSADLWVGSENCQSEDGGDCGDHQFLGTQSSSSFKASNSPFDITYGTGQVSGVIVQDNIVVAGLALAAHTFGVAEIESVEFSDNTTPFDGLMGLAQSTLSNQQVLTPVEALQQQGLIPEAITSYKIARLADGLNDGEITFGGLDATKFNAATLTTVDNVSQVGFWEANMDAVSVNGQDLGLQGRTAILDTGTTLIIAPAADALAIHQLIDGAQTDGQGGFSVPCDTTASVALNFGGQEFAIDPRDLAFFDLGDGNCISGISSGNIGGANEWLVGDVFLKNAYFSTDVTKNTLSLAKLV